MRCAILALAVLAAPASAQAPAPHLARFASSETGALSILEIHTIRTGRSVAINALRPLGEPDAVLAYTDEIAVRDSTYMGNQRAAMFPGSTSAVTLYQVMPGRTHRYSPSLFGLCSGKGALFVGLETFGGSLRSGVFDHTQPLRLYVIEETFEPARINFTLCKAIDFAPS